MFFLKSPHIFSKLRSPHVFISFVFSWMSTFGRITKGNVLCKSGIKTCFLVVGFVCLLSDLPAHADGDSSAVVFGDVPMMLHSTKSEATGNTRLRLAGGLRLGAWLLSFGSGQLGVDGSVALFAPWAKGSPEIFVTPYTTEIMVRGLLGYAMRGSQTSFIPYCYIAASGQFTLVHFHTPVDNTFSANGDVAADGGVGLAVHVNRWMVRMDGGTGYGMNGLLWRTAVALGIQFHL